MEYCLKYGIYQPTNWHCPNPVAALPSYVSRNRHIVFLTSEQVERQLESLADFKELRMAVAIMIYAGLRRAELLWLTQDSISKDLSYLSVVNQTDSEQKVESSLKTGERAVTILPPLRKPLQEYLPILKGKWLIPACAGKRWDGNAFGRRLRHDNRAAKLTWNCLHYRHTYATQRAADGWPLFRITKEMGNSVAVVEEYYAGFIRPHEIENSA
jgi:integrase